MIIVAVIICTVIGAFFIAFGIAHEYSWWQRRKWRLGRGIVVGFTTRSDIDGTFYYPEIEFEGRNSVVRFVSKYGSDNQPTLGNPIKLFIDEQSDAAEVVTMSTRFLGTVVPLVAGMIVLALGHAFISAGQERGAVGRPHLKEAAQPGHTESINSSCKTQ